MNSKVYNQFIIALCSHGLTTREARLVIGEYIEAERIGQHSHGLAALPILLKRLKERKGPVKVIKSQGSAVYLEGNKELSQLAAEKSTTLAAAKAKRYGVGFVGLRNILPFMRPGTYAKKLAERNLVGIVMMDGGRAKVPHPDSSEPVIGTNPTAFGLPTSRGPLVVDMATSKRAWAEVRHAIAEGTKLPSKTYKDKAGKFTRDPKQAFSVVPFGDYKGFALGMVVEILCGGLFGMTMGKHKKSVNHFSASRGAVFIAIDPARFVRLNEFKKKVTKFLREIKTSKRNQGVAHIRIPGESTLQR